jgi:hypothetical protein
MRQIDKARAISAVVMNARAGPVKTAGGDGTVDP